jgi:hypothetical protein
MLGLDDCLQLLGLRVRQLARETSHHLLFQIKADVKNIPGILEGWRSDHGDTVSPKVDETFGRKLAERVTGNSATDTESLTERILRQPVTRLQRPLDDGTAQSRTNRCDAIPFTSYRTFTAGHCQPSSPANR